MYGQTGNVSIGNLKGNGYNMKVKGGKSSNLAICTKAHIKSCKEFEEKYHTSFGSTVPTEIRYTSRTGSVKLKKGDMVYITFQMQKVKSFNLKIE